MVAATWHWNPTRFPSYFWRQVGDRKETLSNCHSEDIWSFWLDSCAELEQLEWTTWFEWFERCAEIMIPAPTGSASGCSRAGLRRRRAAKGLRSLAAKTVQQIQNHTRRLVVTNHLGQEEGGHHSNAQIKWTEIFDCTQINPNEQAGVHQWFYVSCFNLHSSPVVSERRERLCKPFSAFTCVFCFEPFWAI